MKTSKIALYSSLIVNFFLIAGYFIKIPSCTNKLIDKRIRQAINDPQFIRKVAARPFIIFDETGKIIVPKGAMQYLKAPPRIKYIKDKMEEYFMITVTSKEYLQHPPIIEKLGGPPVYPQEPKRMKDIANQFVYKLFLPGAFDPPMVKNFVLFRLEIILNS